MATGVTLRSPAPAGVLGGVVANGPTPAGVLGGVSRSCGSGDDAHAQRGCGQGHTYSSDELHGVSFLVGSDEHVATVTIPFFFKVVQRGCGLKRKVARALTS